VLIAILFDTAAMSARKIIQPSTKKLARKERLNYVTNYCLGNPTAAIMGIVPSA
jgi:hypothetical protein